MYLVGSKVVHPCHGAGTIVGVQRKGIGGRRRRYYVIRAPARKMHLMVPVGRANEMGLRYVSEPETLRRVLDACYAAPAQEEIEPDYQKRRQEFAANLKTGSIEKVASVVSVLCFISSRRRLAMTDREFLKRGKRLLASELALASGLDTSSAMKEIETGLQGMLETLRLREVLASRDTAPNRAQLEEDATARRDRLHQQVTSGSFAKALSAVRALFLAASRRPLGWMERLTLKRGKQFLAGELARASRQPTAEAMREVEEGLTRALDESQEQSQVT